MTQKQEYHIIELVKATKYEDEKSELMDWINLINNPESERTKQIMEENEIIKDTYDELTTFSQDERERALAEAREKTIRDVKSVYLLGIEDEKETIAKELLKMNLSVEQIMQATKLSKEQVLAIKKKLEEK